MWRLGALINNTQHRMMVDFEVAKGETVRGESLSARLGGAIVEVHTVGALSLSELESRPGRSPGVKVEWNDKILNHLFEDAPTLDIEIHHNGAFVLSSPSPGGFRHVTSGNLYDWDYDDASTGA